MGLTLEHCLRVRGGQAEARQTAPSPHPTGIQGAGRSGLSSSSSEQPWTQSSVPKTSKARAILASLRWVFAGAEFSVFIS